MQALGTKKSVAKSFICAAQACAFPCIVKVFVIRLSQPDQRERSLRYNPTQLPWRVGQFVPESYCYRPRELKCLSEYRASMPAALYCRLRGHTASVCCLAVPKESNIVISGGEVRSFASNFEQHIKASSGRINAVTWTCNLKMGKGNTRFRLLTQYLPRLLLKIQGCK